MPTQCRVKSLICKIQCWEFISRRCPRLVVFRVAGNGKCKTCVRLCLRRNVEIISEVNKFFRLHMKWSRRHQYQCKCRLTQNLNVAFRASETLFPILRFYPHFLHIAQIHTHTRARLDRHSLERSNANGNPFSCDSICRSHIQDASRASP